MELKEVGQWVLTIAMLAGVAVVASFGEQLANWIWSMAMGQ